MTTAIRTTTATLAALAAVITTLLLTGLVTVTTYSGANAGVTVSVAHSCTGLGFEYRGQVGPFTNLCQ